MNFVVWCVCGGGGVGGGGALFINQPVILDKHPERAT